MLPIALRYPVLFGLDDYVFWFCDECGDYLNMLKDFDRAELGWSCTKCGYKKDMSSAHVE